MLITKCVTLSQFSEVIQCTTYISEPVLPPCNGDPGAECGWAGISSADCIRLGCCYNDVPESTCSVSLGKSYCILGLKHVDLIYNHTDNLANARKNSLQTA